MTGEDPMHISLKHLVPIVAFAACSTVFGAITFTPDVADINGFAAVDKITWTDSKGWAREAYFAKDLAANAKSKGYITRYVWKADAATTVTCNEPGPSGQLSGFCFTTDHNAAQWSCQKTEGFNFTQSVLFSGTNHLIYRVKFNQYGTNRLATSPSYVITVDWVFCEGLDYFLYAITYDCSASPNNTFDDDTRSPYSEFDWDGNGSTGGNISGFAFGTRRKFVTNNMASWTYTDSAYVPFVQEWIDATDRECGYVQTQANNQHVGGGGDWVYDQWTSYTGTALPENWRLPYQMNSYQGYTTNRLTWGLPYGCLDGGVGTGLLYQCYTLEIVVGK
jgi:hypothetical protein